MQYSQATRGRYRCEQSNPTAHLGFTIPGELNVIIAYVKLMLYYTNMVDVAIFTRTIEQRMVRVPGGLPVAVEVVMKFKLE